MPGMGKTEEDWNGLKLGSLKTVQPNSFSKLIPAACKTEEDWNGLKLGFLKTVHVCNFKNNAQETY